MVVWDLRHNIDHYPVLGFLRRSAPAAHSRYLRERNRFPLKPLKIPGGVNRLFAELQGVIPKPPCQERPRYVCISPETWQLIDTSIASLQSRDGTQGCVQTLSRKIKEKLQEDQRRRAAKAGSAVEFLLASDPPLIREVWIRMQG